MEAVANKRTTPDDSEGKKPKRTGVPVYAYVDPELRHALDRYLEETRPNPSLTSALEVALEEFLKARGYWPPKRKGG
jgi:hypothetical protein